MSGGAGRPGARAVVGPFRGDDRGQQFVLEAAIVAIIAVTTIVMVVNIQPSQPAVGQPETHVSMRKTARDTLDSLRASPAPSCEGADGVLCHRPNKLVSLVVSDLYYGTNRTCRWVEGTTPDGVRPKVILEGPLAEAVVCGEDPPPDEDTSSEAAHEPVMLGINYAHVFTDLQAYNGNDADVVGNDVLTKDGLTSVETRADMRVYVLPTRSGLPVAASGAAIEAILDVEGSAVGDRTFRSFGTTQESATDDAPFGAFYAEDLPWCRPWSPATGCTNPAETIEGNVSYDLHLDDRYFPPSRPIEDPAYEADVDLEVTINETAGQTIQTGTRLICKVPPDWDLDLEANEESELGARNSDFQEFRIQGSTRLGWTVSTELTSDLAAGGQATATFNFSAVPPNPLDSSASNDPHVPVYVFRCWLENHAHSQLDIPVHLDPEDPDTLPATAGVLVTVSPASPMGHRGDGWYGVSVRNPTAESLTVTDVQLRHADGLPVFSRLNLSSTTPSNGTWRVSGLQGRTEELDNGGFDAGIPPWDTSVWTPDNTWDPPFWANRTVVTTDSLGMAHVLYTRTDGRIVHMWKNVTADGTAAWEQELTPYHGLLGPESAVFDHAGTFDTADDDTLHIYFRGLSDRNPGRGLWHATRTDDTWGSEPTRLATFGEIDGHRAHPTEMRAFLEDGVSHVAFLVRTEGGTPDPQANYTGLDHAFYLTDDPTRYDEIADCDFAGDGWRDAGWWCRTIPGGDGDEIRKFSADLGPDKPHFAFQVNEGPADFAFRYCAYPCQERVDVQETLSMFTGQPVDIMVDDTQTVHLALSWPEGGIHHATSTSPASAIDGLGCATSDWTCTKVSDHAGWELAITRRGLGDEVEILYNNAETGTDSSSQLYHVYPSETSSCITGVDWACKSLDREGSGLMLSVDRGPRGVTHAVSLGADGSATNGTLRYLNSRLSRDRWSFETGPTFERDSQVGGAIQATADADGDVHVAYQDETADLLMYARWDAQAETWRHEVVDAGAAAGWRTDIVVDDGVPRIAYYVDGELRIADRTSEGGCRVQGNWTCTTLGETVQDPSAEVDLAMDVDANGTVAILFQRPTGAMTVALESGGLPPCSASSWRCLEVTTPAVSPVQPDMVAAGDALHVAWHDGTGTRTLRYARSDRTAGSYTAFTDPVTLDTSVNAGLGPVLAADATRLGILYGGSFQDAANGFVGTGARYIENVSDVGSADGCLDTWTCENVLKGDRPHRGALRLADGEVTGLHVGEDGKVTSFRRDAASSCGTVEGFACEDLFDVEPSADTGVHAAAMVEAGDAVPRTVVLFERDGELRAMHDLADDGSCPDDASGTCEVVDPGRRSAMTGEDPGIAVDRYGRPHVVHYDRGAGNLLYSVRRQESWETTVVDRGSARSKAGNDLATAWQADGTMHAVYGADAPLTAEQVTGDQAGREVRYMTNATGSWASDRIDAASASGFTAAVHEGTVHAAWWDEDAEALVHATPVAAGTGTGCGNATWDCTVLDAPSPDNQPIAHPSIGVRDDGTVLVAYQRGGRELWVARSDGTGGCSAGGWSCQALDTTGPTGFDASLAVAPDGTTVGVAYYSDADTGLHYVEDGGTGFGAPVSVMPFPSGTAGRYADLAFAPSGEPRIGYWAWELDPAEQFQDYLYEARRTDGTWTTERIGHWNNSWLEDVTLDVSDGGESIIGMTQWTPGQVLRLVREGSGTCTDNGGEASGWTCRPLAGHRKIEHPAVLAGAKPHLATYTPLEGTVRVARNVSDGWDVEDLPAGALGRGDVGYYASIDLQQPHGRDVVIPHVSYYDRANGALKYATREDGAWVNTTVEDLGDTGMFTSLAWSGRPMIAYYDAYAKEFTASGEPYFRGQLRFAERTGGSWSTTLINGTQAHNRDTGRFASLAVDVFGRPVIMYQHMQPSQPSQDTSELEKSLMVARRGGSFFLWSSDGGGAHVATPGPPCPQASGWTCTTLESVSTGFETSNGLFSATTWDAARTGIWPAFDARRYSESGLYDKVAEETHTLALAREGRSGVSCPGDIDWSCDDVESGARTPYYAGLAFDSRETHVGMFVRPTDPTEETERLPELPGSWRPTTSELVSVTDASVTPDPPCALLATFECRSVLSDRRLARPSMAVGPRDNGFVAVESADDNTFVFGSNRDWGRVVLQGGIDFETADRSIGNPMLNATRVFSGRTMDREEASIEQSFGVDRDPTSTILTFDWRKQIQVDTLNRDDLRLERFDVTASLVDLDASGDPAEVVWRSGRRSQSSWQSVTVDVTSQVDQPGRYALRFTVDVRGAMDVEGATATIAFSLDDVGLETHLNKRTPVGNSGFEDSNDRIESPGYGWDRADDGGWEAATRFGYSDTYSEAEDRYTKIWIDDVKRGETSLLETDRYATTEFVHMEFPVNASQEPVYGWTNDFDQTFSIDEVDGELPSSVDIGAGWYQWARWEGGLGTGEPQVWTSGGRSFSVGVSGTPDCNRWNDPAEEDPCSSWSTTTGETGPTRQVLEDGSEIEVTFTLRHEDGNATVLRREVTSLEEDDPINATDCQEACFEQPFDYDLAQDLTSFVRSEGAGDYTIEVRTRVEIKIDEAGGVFDGVLDDDPWLLIQVVTGVDDVIVEANYKGGDTVHWRGSRVVDAKSSADWAVKIGGNGLDTSSAGERVEVPATYSNGYERELLHMPDHGLYVRDVRPADVSCDATDCEDEGGGYAVASEACVNVTMGDADNPIRGSACYENRASAAITVGLQQAIRDKSWIEVKNGTGRYNTIPAETEDGVCNYAHVAWDLDAIEETLTSMETDLGPDFNLESVAGTTIRVRSPLYGQEVWSRTFGATSGSTEVPLCDFTFQGAYVVEASMKYFYEAENQLGTIVNATETARKIDYFTLVPPAGSAGGGADSTSPPSAPIYDVELRLWWYDL